MAITIVRGPAGSGKAQSIRERIGPGEIVADFTLLAVALTGCRARPGRKVPRA